MRKVDKLADLPKFKIVIDPEDTDLTGISFISLVENPAIKIKAHMYSEREFKKTFAFKSENDKMRMTGPIMIADMDILRKDDDGNKYTVRFDSDTIDIIMAKFMRNLDNKSVFNESHGDEIAPAYLLETWKVEDPHDTKCRKHGFTGIPVGSQMVTCQVTDRGYWEDKCMKGLFGFSVEGMMGETALKLSAIRESIERKEKIPSNFNFSFDLSFENMSEEQLLKEAENQIKILNYLTK